MKQEKQDKKAIGNEFERIKSKFSSVFVNEYVKKGFHDHKIVDFQIRKTEHKTKRNISITIVLEDYFKEWVHHVITLNYVNLFKASFDFGIYENTVDWAYDEILLLNGKKLSLEVDLYDHSTLYVEFEKLKYQKINLKTRGRR